jgi:DNA-binding CsgD family transcriptional regulator
MARESGPETGGTESARAARRAGANLTTLHAALSKQRLAYTLTRLDDLVVEAATEGARALLGLPMDRLVGRPALELLDPKDRAAVKTSVEALRSGAIDFFMAHRRGFGARRPSRGLAVWVYAIEVDGVRYALSRWMDPTTLARAKPPSVGAIDRCVGMAVVDRQGVVKAVIDHLGIGLALDDLVGKTIIPAAEIRRLLALPEIRTIRAEGLSLAGPVTLRVRSGGSITVQGVATALAGSEDWLVALLDLDETPTGREAQLEAHLWRIAAEIEASGILLRAATVPKLALARIPEAAALSPRQWDILRRLTAGQRVPAIAAELFVSQSTVRSHLARIFERFDVHSQPQLLARLSSMGGSKGEKDAPSRTMDDLSIA